MMYKTNEIMKMVTNEVVNYVKNGYVISPTMRGTYSGELYKVDLHKGNRVIRIFVEEGKSDIRSDYYGDMISIVTYCFDIFSRKEVDLNYLAYKDLWNREENIISKVNLYGDRVTSTYFDKESYLEILHKREVRMKSGAFETYVPFYRFDNEAKNIVLEFVRRKPKCKSVKVSDIGEVVKYISDDGKATYSVMVKGNTYFMH